MTPDHSMIALIFLGTWVFDTYEKNLLCLLPDRSSIYPYTLSLSTVPRGVRFMLGTCGQLGMACPFLPNLFFTIGMLYPHFHSLFYS